MEQKCISVQTKFSEYLDNELDGAQKAHVDFHIRECAECRHELHKFENAVMAVRSLPRMEAPAGLAEGVMERTEPRTAMQRPAIIRLWPNITAVAASVLLTSALTLMVSARHFGRPEHLSESALPADMTEPAEIDTVESPEPARRDEISAASVMRRTEAPPRERQMSLQRDIADLRARTESLQAPGVQQLSKEICLDETPTLDTIDMLNDMVQSIGARNILIAIDTAEEYAGFELNFDLHPDEYERFEKALQESPGFRDATLQESRRALALGASEALEYESDAMSLGERGLADDAIESIAEAHDEEAAPDRAGEMPGFINVNLRVSGRMRKE